MVNIQLTPVSLDCINKGKIGSLEGSRLPTERQAPQLLASERKKICNCLNIQMVFFLEVNRMSKCQSIYHPRHTTLNNIYKQILFMCKILQISFLIVMKYIHD